MASFINLSLSFSQSDESTSLNNINLSCFKIILQYVLAYFAPIAYIICIINNTIIIYIFAYNKPVANITSKALRIYYSFLAFCDINYSSSTVLFSFLGK